VNEQKDQRNHQPDDRNGEHEAGEDLLHGLLSTINQGSGVRDQVKSREPAGKRRRYMQISTYPYDSITVA
jgi:hypothetical protein